MKRILVFVLIICMVFLLIVGAQEEKLNETHITITDEKTAGKPVKESVEPVLEPVTRLKITMIDGINEKVFEIKNCIVQIVGELNICDNIFPYRKTFVNGNDYEITIWIKPKN